MQILITAAAPSLKQNIGSPRFEMNKTLRTKPDPERSTKTSSFRYRHRSPYTTKTQILSSPLGLLPRSGRLEAHQRSSASFAMSQSPDRYFEPEHIMEVERYRARDAIVLLATKRDGG
jgi:hypothetical protein